MMKELETAIKNIVQNAIESTMSSGAAEKEKANDTGVEHRRFIRVDEAAALMSLSVTYLNKLRCTGEGPVFRKVGRAVLYDADDIAYWLDNKTRESTSVSLSDAKQRRFAASQSKNTAVPSIKREVRYVDKPVFPTVEAACRSWAEELNASPAKSYIYFILCAQKIKIGYSETPTSRLEKLKTGMPSAANAVFIVQGTLADEKRLHAELKQHRRHGEWFDLTPEVMIAMLREIKLLNVFNTP